MSDTLSRLTAALRERYRIDRELGAGGMATVYLAHDLKHDRKVAIKVLKAELAAVIGGARFLSEIRTTANLQHAHILSLHDSGEAAGTVFYVMPFVDGESLRDRLDRERQLPIDAALRIASEVADALQYAREHGVIHRDIKPENILLHGGHALVADFGFALAASTGGGARMTETGISLGTPTYMSPEQAMGERRLDARTDVYALGCVDDEMVVGVPPFIGASAQAIVAKVITEKPASIIAVRDRVPEHVAQRPRVHRWLPESRAVIAARGLAACTAHQDNGQVATLSSGAAAPPSAVAPSLSSYDEARAYARGGACETADMTRSSWIRGAEFCHREALDRGYLIETINAREYIHAGVPNAVWAAFRDAASPGGFYTAQLRGRYRLSLSGSHRC